MTVVVLYWASLESSENCAFNEPKNVTLCNQSTEITWVNRLSVQEKSAQIYQSHLELGKHCTIKHFLEEDMMK